MGHPYYGRQGGGPFRGGRARGGGGPRLLHRGQLRLLLLHCLEAGPRHGYELIKDIEALTSGVYSPSPGILYPTLALLEDVGAVVATEDGARKSLTLTPEGLAELRSSPSQLTELLARLDSAGKARTAADSGPVRRALDNLEQVLAEHAGATLSGREVQHDIADIIDEAARRIERL